MGAPHVAIVVQNLPLRLDRRVRNEARALVDAGYRVTVVCPRDEGDPPVVDIDGARVHGYRPAPEADGLAGFVRESVESWVRTARILLEVHRREPLDAIQACNPPDTYAALAAPFRLAGVRFVFDHHDLCPEIYETRFGRDRGAGHRLLLALEGMTFRVADHVISPNESYRAVATGRGRRAHADTTVVVSAPDPDVLRPGPPHPELRRGREHLCCYLGVMGHQDGVDTVVRAADVIVHELGRTDCHFALLGFGDCLADLRRLASDLDLDDHVTFTGRADVDVIRRYLSTADVGLCPDPPSPFNDVSTMNKVLEYQAFGVPGVAFDLHETRVAGGPAIRIAPAADVGSFARTVVELLDDPTARAAMGAAGRARIEQEWNWARQAATYVGVYDRLLRGESGEPGPGDREVATEPMAGAVG